MNYQDSVPIERRSLNVIFIIDSSAMSSNDVSHHLMQSLDGALNRIKTIEEKSADVKFRVSAMSCSSDIRWGEDLKSIEDLANLFSSDSSDRESINLGEVFDELNLKSSSSTLFSMDQESKRGSFPPLYIFLLQGNSYNSWEESCKCLCQNNWYKYGARIIVSYGQITDERLALELHAQEFTITDPHQFPSIIDQIIAPVDIIASCRSITSDIYDDIYNSRMDNYYQEVLGDRLGEYFGSYCYS